MTANFKIVNGEKVLLTAEEISAREAEEAAFLADRAANGAAISHLNIANSAGQRCQCRYGTGDLRGGGDNGVARHGADGKRIAVHLDAAEFGQAVQIDQFRRR